MVSRPGYPGGELAELFSSTVCGAINGREEKEPIDTVSFISLPWQHSTYAESQTLTSPFV